MNGILVMDKPGGLTSTGAVNILKKVLNVRKAGHIGTLDPLATGVLPVCLNKATKIIPFLDNKTKEYIAKIELGIFTDTLDTTGKIIKSRKVGKIDKGDILNCFRNFEGTLEQIPPMYSALKQNGVRLYELARRGIEVERKPRKVEIYGLELIDYSHPVIKFKVRCSEGTYIRVLCSDIGSYLGTVASMKELRRTQSGEFKTDESYTLEDVKEGKFELVDIDQALNNLRALEVDTDTANHIRHGRPISRSVLSGNKYCDFQRGEILKVRCNGHLVSVVKSLVSCDEMESCDTDSKIFNINRVFG